MNEKSTVYIETTIPSFLEEKIMNDPIVTEVREQRMKILESYDWDFRKMSRDIMKRQFRSGHKVVSFGKRTPQPGVAPNACQLRGQA